jgi:hypothetical protein
MNYSTVRLPETSPTHTRVVTPSPPLVAVVKSLLVDALGIILAWCPTIAMILGKVMTVLWPDFRRA